MPIPRIILAFCLICLVSSGLRAQKTVSPPPRPQPDGPSLASILDSLKQTLLASGELTYTYGSFVARLKISDVAVNAAECRMRVTRIESFGDNPAQETTDSIFLETIDSAEVATIQEAYNRTFLVDKMTAPGGYETMLNGNESRLRFADRALAMRVAELLRQASNICRATPAPLNAAAGKPSLGETLRFVEQKLNDEGVVSHQSQSVENPERAAHSQSTRVLDARADPDACLLRFRVFQTYDNKPSYQSNVVLSFRRVQKLEVMTTQQVWDRIAAMLPSPLRLTPETYTCRVTYSGGADGADVEFHDEDMTNRVAKAMNHAADLCSGENKEPF